MDFKPVWTRNQNNQYQEDSLMENIYETVTTGYTKHPTLKDTEPTIEGISYARRVRDVRERHFTTRHLNRRFDRTGESPPTSITNYH